MDYVGEFRIVLYAPGIIIIDASGTLKNDLLEDQTMVFDMGTAKLTDKTGVYLWRLSSVKRQEY